MIDGKRVLGLIPARGGSKGIKRKNIRLLGDKPLIAWTIDEAKKSKYIDQLVVSTDNQEIAEIALKFGAEVPFIRPSKLANDSARGIDVVRHSLTKISNIDVVILLQPTSPFRIVEDIDKALLLWGKDETNVIGVTETDKSPYWMYSLDATGNLSPLLVKPLHVFTRQQLPMTYVLNGSLYIASREFVFKNESLSLPQAKPFIMPMERSIDLDTEKDWLYAEFMINMNKIKSKN